MTESSPSISEVEAPAEAPPETSEDSIADTPAADATDEQYGVALDEPGTDPDDGASVGSDTQPDLMPDQIDDQIDLDSIESDLAGVEQALARLADGTYWTDEVTGATIPDEVLEADPIARRVVRH